MQRSGRLASKLRQTASLNTNANVAFRVQQLIYTPLNLSSRSFSSSHHLFSQQQQQQDNNDTNKLTVLNGVAYLPKHANKNRKGLIDCGEDAYFITTKFNDQQKKRVCAVGVSDGVGGYAQYGVDPAAMAWALMDGCQKYIENDSTISANQALTLCYNEILDKQLVAVGGATACLLTISKPESNSSFLEIDTCANLGDSAFMVIRDGSVIFRTKDQTHFFNCPYQLSAPREAKEVVQDSPAKSETISQPIQLAKGDVIVVGTDGLTDNVFDKDVVTIVTELINSSAGSTEESDDNIAQKIANSLLKDAAIKARSPQKRTPFQDYAAKHGYRFLGGKVDDITIVVCVIA